jgi:hypothetical protein
MRSYLAVVFAVVVVFGAKLVLFPAPAAETGLQAVKAGTLDVLQMHVDHPGMKALPLLGAQDPT